MRQSVRDLALGGFLSALVFFSLPAFGQDPNMCDEPGEAPDVIVGDLFNVGNYGNAGDYYGYSIGTTSCNVGTCWLKWFSQTNEHPVIAQNMYRIKEGRLEQIGQSWLKHGFFALSNELCNTGCVSTNGTHLGVNCSDPYVASLNGSQGSLGPRSEVNPFSGVFPYPFTGIGETGDEAFRRIRVHRDDLDPALNPGAIYFVEGQYVTQDDAAAGNGFNNNSWREITVDPFDYDINLIGSTTRSQSATRGWAILSPGVFFAVMNVSNEGQFHVGANTFLNPNGTRRFVYAIQNINSDRAARRFWVPVPQGANVTNIGFHDIDSHSGDPYDTTDWTAFYDYPNSRVVWETSEFAENPWANSLRWGTAYTFWFDLNDTAIAASRVEAGLFKPVAGEPDVATSLSAVYTPAACNGNGVCEGAETCDNCPGDCTGLNPPTGFCGDGICDLGLGEDCTNCADCNGVQSGNPNDRYCCGAGGGSNPIPCTDARCTAGGMTCGTSESPTCCGDGVCDAGEDPCSCAEDCGPVPPAEATCNDGVDNDCDGTIDCGDLDCCTDGSCADGSDNDNDGVSDCDCDDNDPSIWGRPAETGMLTLNDGGVPGTTLTWGAPADPGATSVEYETLRVSDVAAFPYVTSCITDPSPGDLTASDFQDPASGETFYYLVRATNNCPGPAADGSLGQNSGAVERVGRTCP